MTMSMVRRRMLSDGNDGNDDADDNGTDVAYALVRWSICSGEVAGGGL